jgi:hypothetical protein
MIGGKPMNGASLTWLYDSAKRKEAHEIALGDVLDVKASIVLVVIAFLGTVSGGILSAASPRVWVKWLQIVVVITLALASIFGFRALWPADYWLEDFPDKYKNWIGELESYYEVHGLAGPLQDLILGEDLKTVAKRIDKNHQLNARKSLWLFRSFRLLVPALTAEVISLACLAHRVL